MPRLFCFSRESSRALALEYLRLDTENLDDSPLPQEGSAHLNSSETLSGDSSTLNDFLLQSENLFGGVGDSNQMDTENGPSLRPLDAMDLS